MKCRFCDAEESCFVELLAWDVERQRARELLLQGVCMMHANDMPPHPRDPTVFQMHPAYEDRIERLGMLHAAQFVRADFEAYELRFGQQYFPLDSLEGSMVKAARGGHVDKAVAHIVEPDAIPIERVPDEAALAEVMRDAAKAAS
jgi:hypothetical protein